MGFFDFLKTKTADENFESLEVSNETIMEAAHKIADDCVSGGDMSNPKWLKIYNNALDNMYGNALYLGYGESNKIHIDLNDPLDAGAKMTLENLKLLNAPKENIQKALFRLLKDKKFSDAEKNIFSR